ncbi:aminoglycoside phosphotransferase family protein [Pseudoroseicyclus sp. H15]
MTESAPDADTFRRLWQLGPLTKIATTRSSTLYRCDSPHGPAVLKHLTEAGADEHRGAAALRHWQGRSAARLYAEAPGAMLLQYLPGPSLGARIRAHGDGTTFPSLAALIRRLHSVPQSLLQENPRGGATGAGGRQPPSITGHPTPLLCLEEMFSPLLQSDAPLLAAPRAAAHQLFATPRPAVVLHGDFHHDNIIEPPEGWKLIDPKGLYGDPGFETANLFRNPVGREDLALSPARIRALAEALGDGLEEEPGRLVAWGLALVGLSELWNQSSGLPTSFDRQMQAALAAALADIPNGSDWA